jgi:hypothetical protein
MSLNIISTCASFLGGIFCKLYDDLTDNYPELSKNLYISDTFLEFLKGLHYICFTIVSIDNPLFFINLYVDCVTHHFGNDKAFNKPYEISLFFSFGLLFFFINYKKIEIIDWAEYFILFILICGLFFETPIIKVEYSVIKFLSRLFGTFFFILLLYLFPNMSISMKYILIYFLGYTVMSAISQFYLVFIYKKEEIDVKKEVEIKKEVYVKKEVELKTAEEVKDSIETKVELEIKE